MKAGYEIPALFLNHEYIIKIEKEFKEGISLYLTFFIPFTFISSFIASIDHSPLLEGDIY